MLNWCPVRHVPLLSPRSERGFSGYSSSDRLGLLPKVNATNPPRAPLVSSIQPADNPAFTHVFSAPSRVGGKIMKSELADVDCPRHAEQVGSLGVVSGHTVQHDGP